MKNLDFHDNKQKYFSVLLASKKQSKFSLAKIKNDKSQKNNFFCKIITKAT